MKAAGVSMRELAAATGVLGDMGIQGSMAGTSLGNMVYADFGILRGIVSDPDRAYKALKDNHFAVNVTDVVGISCPNIPGALAKVLGYLSDEGVFIEYMYSFANNNIANVVIRPSNLDKCIEVLKEKKVDLLAASDLYKL